MLTKRVFGLGWVLAGLVPWYVAYQYTANAAAQSARKDPTDTSYNRKRGY
jgi:hypothetical protein